jgi:hypothetical protein
MRNQDLTATCVDINNKEMVAELRRVFCSTCRNPVCGYAQKDIASPSWAERMDTQVDRLLIHPNIVAEGFEDIRSMPFESLLTQAIRVTKAVNAGDWSIEAKDQLAWRPSQYVEESGNALNDEIVEEANPAFTESFSALTGKSLADPEVPSATPEEEEPEEELEEDPSPESGLKKFVIEKVVHREPPSNPVGHAPPMSGSTPPVPVSPKMANTRHQQGMVVGPAPEKIAPSDSWGIPTGKVNTVPVGAKIKM